jgi:hypothetical protein
MQMIKNDIGALLQLPIGSIPGLRRVRWWRNVMICVVRKIAQKSPHCSTYVSEQRPAADVAYNGS